MRVEFEALAQNDVVVATSGMTISRVQGYFNGALNAWLQLHDAKETPVNGAVPLRVWPLYSTAPFDQNFQNDPIAVTNGCVFVVSLLANRATLAISAETMDIFVNGEKSLDTVGVTEAGNYVDADEILQVWAQGSPGKKLLRLEVSDEDEVAGPFWVQIHAANTPLTNKIVKTFPVDSGSSLDVCFGDGLDIVREVGGTLFQGCTIALSSTENTYTALGSNTDYIKATYK
jgi:hypothetical protein